MTMMRRYMVDQEEIVLVQKAEYNFDRYLLWAGLLDKGDFIVIDGTLATEHLDRKLGR